MPYIKDKDRSMFYEAVHLGADARCAGDLNYIFTKVALGYIYDKGEKYQNYNDIIGALEGCKLELYRRHIAPYEDEKIKENGDVE